MPKRLEDAQISTSRRIELIRTLACFKMLTQQEAVELGNLMQVFEYDVSEVIVTESMIVDSVFIIVEGQAEVTKEFSKKNKITRKIKTTQVPLASLGPGDAIGLNDTGFFSTSGQRTATVTANTKVTALVLNLKELHDFLRGHSHLQPAMYATAEQMLKVKLIKQSLAFNRLSYERLNWLAAQVEEVSHPKGSVIFNQGETGDQCYLIRSGEVEIVSKEEDGTEHTLALLKSPTLFGEATLITRSPRNATARALTDCVLLTIRHEYLSELLETESNVADMFMTLMVDRSRPLKNPQITIHERSSLDGQEIVILKNPETGKYFKLSKEGHFIWSQMDGKQTMQEITLAMAEQFGLFAPDIVAALISKLSRSGFVMHVDTASDSMCSTKQPAWIRGMLRLRRILEARIAIGDADKFLTKIYKNGMYVFFKKPGQIALGILAIVGLIIFGMMTNEVIDTFRVLPDAWYLLLMLIPSSVLTIVLHELGHAFATKSFGQEVHYLGVGWYWLGPIAFTDTSDMWLSTRWPRVIVNFAGIYADVLVAGTAALFMLITINPYLQAFLWLFSLFTYINAFRMLSPLQEWDGYYILMDVLDRPRLRQSAVLWLINDFSKSLKHPQLFKKHIPEIVYWLYCILFLILVSLLTLLVQGFVFKMLGLHANIWVSLTLPFVVVLISCLGILADLRGKT